MIKKGTHVYLVDGLNLPVGTQTLGYVSHIFNYNNVEREHLKRVRAAERVANTEEAKLLKDQQKAKTLEDKIRIRIEIDHNAGNYTQVMHTLDSQFTELLSKELVVVSFPTVLVTADQSELIVVDQGAVEVEDEPERDYSGFE